MYQIITVKDTIKVPPQKLSLDPKEAVKQSIRENMEGRIYGEIGIVLDVKEVKGIGEGKILPGDGSVHYDVDFSLLTWMPKEHELVEGYVTDITEFGVFLRIGPLDGFIHISQIMDDFVSFDEKNSQLVGKSTKRILKVGDSVRARIISISLKEQNKVGLTLRQPLLGSLKWLEEDKKKAKKEDKQEKKKEEKQGK